MNETYEYMMARVGRADRWVPANSGNETPFTARSGRRLLYCWNPATSQHAYLDCDNDIILTDAEAADHMR